MMKAGQTALVLAALILSLIAIVAAVIAVVEVEKGVKQRQGNMSVVYGKSFTDLPHAPLERGFAPDLERTAVGAPKFELSRVAGASFSHPWRS
jgi:hypothetical protein